MGNKRIFDYDLFLKRVYEVAGTDINDRLTEMLNLPHGKFTKWKTGKGPSIQDLLQIADEFNCSIDYLLGLDTTEADTDSPAELSPETACRFIHRLHEKYLVEIIDIKANEENNRTGFAIFFDENSPLHKYRYTYHYEMSDFDFIFEFLKAVNGTYKNAYLKPNQLQLLIEDTIREIQEYQTAHPEAELPF